MALTDQQRENRALFNLDRASEPLTRRQLYCASVREANINALAEARAIEQAPCGGFAITPTGTLELYARIQQARASTITAVAA